ncbi:MAG: ankyrin repeat domain-containing protein [Alphaproteobacteria bacterium]|nr:ankyrin repeat domain-containing protein [Alphaproteobacteria bacterium]
MKEKLIRAAENNQIAEVERLLADFEFAKIRALRASARKGYLKVSLRLIKAGVDVNAPNEAGCTPLMFAVCGGHLDVLKALIQQGADVLKKNNMGKDAYHFAMFKGDKVIAKEIINTVKKKMMFCLVSQNQLVTLERE